jgi:OOP family OmpA-OmpF porin
MNTSSTRTLQTLGLAGLALLAVPQAWALEGGFGYGGVSLGRSQGSFGSEAQVATGLAPGASVSSFARDTRDTGFKLFGGVQFNRNLALEAGYFDLGKPGYSAVLTPAGTVDGRFRLNGANVDLLGMLPLGPQWSALVRAGVVAGRTRATFVTTGPVALADVSQRRTNGKLGVGLQYSIGSSLLVRAEVERYRFNDAVQGHVNVNHLSVGLVVPFGASPAPMARAPEPAPVYVPPPPALVMAPAPVIVVQAPPPVVQPPAPPPPPVQRRRVSFSAESLFGFDRSDISPEGRSALDGFVRELDSIQFEQVVVEGHTDRLGTTEYNLLLSQQRADAVKNYLVISGHVDPMKISATGKGEAVPHTQPSDCPGTRSNAALIICLKPDRRVEVDVVGTR